MRLLSTLALSAASLLMTATAATAQSIADLWSNNCANCHGARGEGGGGGTRTLLTDDLFQASHDRPFFEAIRNGVEDTAMPGYSRTMSEAQIWGLVVHIRELQLRDIRRREVAPKETNGAYQTAHAAYKIESVVDGLDNPWSVAFLPDTGDITGMLVTERPGPVRIFVNGKLSKPIDGTPRVRNRGQGGMMDVAPHPDFARNGWVYLAYADEKQQDGRSAGMTKVVRGKITRRDAGYAWTDQQTIFEAKADNYLRGDIHFGCRIVFEGPQPDGRYFVYFAIGERGMGNHAQDLARPNGKVHRLWDDGKVPADNPFSGRDAVYQSIWTYGNRNPQGLAFALDGKLWETEHAPRGGDEFNLLKRGGNYGWPEVSFGINYDGSAYRTPWAPNAANGAPIIMPADRWLPSIAACGLDVMRGDAFPAWNGDLMAGGLAGQTISRLRVKDDAVVEREEVFYGHGRVRDVVCGPDGMIYIVMNGPDAVLRLAPAAK